jgi:hypothetical protein
MPTSPMPISIALCAHLHMTQCAPPSATHHQTRPPPHTRHQPWPARSQDTPDIDAYGKPRLQAELQALDTKHLGAPRDGLWGLQVCELMPSTSYLILRHPISSHLMLMTWQVRELVEAIRPHVQPQTQLPKLVLPVGHAVGALMGNAKSFQLYGATHEAEGGLLHDLNLDAGSKGVHPRVATEPYTFARRITRAHSKMVVGLYSCADQLPPAAEPHAAPSAAGSSSSKLAPTSHSPYGWLYMGSHNFSATAWGDPTSLAVGEGEALGLVQHSSWECGVLLVVPRGTPHDEAERRMSFDAWPLPFDPMRLCVYGPEEQLDARDEVCDTVEPDAAGDCDE